MQHLIDRLQRDNPSKHIVTENRFNCVKVTRADEREDDEYENCDDIHSTPGQARAHCKQLGYTHIERHTIIGYIEPALGCFVIEEDDGSGIVSIKLPYTLAIKLLTD